MQPPNQTLPKAILRFQFRSITLIDLQVNRLREAAVAGAIVGFLFVIWLLPVNFLLGKSGLWWIGDPGCHVSALRAYLNDVWHFPPLNTVNLNYPQGINAAFVDIIPVMALPTKLISTFLPNDFHYFGFWLVFAYTSQL